jgi:hypothetical protein
MLNNDLAKYSWRRSPENEYYIYMHTVQTPACSLGDWKNLWSHDMRWTICGTQSIIPVIGLHYTVSVSTFDYCPLEHLAPPGSSPPQFGSLWPTSISDAGLAGRLNWSDDWIIFDLFVSLVLAGLQSFCWARGVGGLSLVALGSRLRPGDVLAVGVFNRVWRIGRIADRLGLVLVGGSSRRVFWFPGCGISVTLKMLITLCSSDSI